MSLQKSGFSYYNVDTDRYQDIRIKRLRSTYKGMGIAVYDYLLCEIYRDKGYFVVWDEFQWFQVADYFGMSEEWICEVVNYCMEIGLFSQMMWECNGILTSRSIQKRYQIMASRARRKGQIIPKEYDLITEKDEFLPENGEIIPEVCPKEKKRKEKKNKKKDFFSERVCLELFEEFRKIYPGSKRGLETEFANFRKRHPDYGEVITQLIPAIEKQMEWRKQREALREFTPQYPQLHTWINQRRWEVELEKMKNDESEKKPVIID